jgi:hypothetical protein
MAIVLLSVTYTHACTECACHASVASVATGQRNGAACQLCMQRSASVCPSARTRTQPAARVAHASLHVRLPTGQQHDCERWIARLIVEAHTPREHTGGSSPTGCGVCAGRVKGCACSLHLIRRQFEPRFGISRLYGLIPVRP